MSGLATRLYQGQAGINIVGRRILWFTVAGVAVVVAILSFALRGFSFGIEFSGGNEFQVPASVGAMDRVSGAVENAISGMESDGRPAWIVSTQQVGGEDGTYLIRTSKLAAEQSAQVTADLVEELDLSQDRISSSQVSAAWGAQVSQRAGLGLVVFLLLVTVYLVLRFEWRMAVSAVASLVLNLVLTAGIYSLVGFEVTPSTVIGFLTILGFALYDVVVVFDKVQENTRGITGSSVQTYGEAANLAVNQTLMRSINTTLVSLLPVGGLLFIGAGLLGAGTLKDLGLVLFVGMGIATYSSLFFATPTLVTLKEHEPRFQAHTQRVLARRAGLASGKVAPKTSAERAAAKKQATVPESAAAPAGSTPRAGARPSGKRSAAGRSGRPGGRPGGGRKR